MSNLGGFYIGQQVTIRSTGRLGRLVGTATICNPSKQQPGWFQQPYMCWCVEHVPDENGDVCVDLFGYLALAAVGEQ